MKVSRNTLPSLKLRNNAPSSASAAEVMTNFKMAHKQKIAPFILTGSLSFRIEPKKKWLYIGLRAFGSDKYDASEWMFSIS